MLENQWNSNLYESNHAFVWESARSLIELLAPQSRERILDLGCGTGQLTAQIADRGAEVVGIDAAATMVEKARQNYPHLRFVAADARSFHLEQPFDAVFSNAALHWIPEADAVIRCMHQALKPSGRLVAEFGGKGNVQAIVSALYDVLEANNASPSVNPWYFPSIGEYASRLEQQGFQVVNAMLFDRPTPLLGDAAMANWIQMFASCFLEDLAVDQQTQIINSVEQRLQPVLYHQGTWTADYRRLRIVAIKA